MSETLRIALTADPEIPVPPLHYGGIERIIDVLAKGLQQRGHDVTLFANPASTCPVRRVGWMGETSSGIPQSIRNAVTLASRVRSRGFDIVHSFSRLAYLTPLLPLSVPKLMTYQRAISRDTTSAAWRLSRGTLEFSAVSRAMIHGVADIGAWHLVYNGVPLETFDAVDAVPDDAPLVFLGRIEEIKGPHIAIDVARRTGCNLVLAGNIPDAHRAWFAQHIEPHVDGTRVQYIGPVDDAAKNALLGSARALLMPILWEEPFGIVMAEAMACGTPVIGLRRGSVAEVVEDAVTGFVVDDVDGMVAAVQRTSAIDRSACRARVTQRFSDDVVVDGYLAVYQSMIARRRGRRVA